MADSGKLETLSIIAYAKSNYSQQVGDPYKVYLNPKPYKKNHKVAYEQPKTIGSTNADIKFTGVEAEEVSFEILLDGTGVIPSSTGDVDQQLKQFKSVVYDYNGDIHCPNYLKLLWGSFLFKGKLVSLDIDYTLFDASGAPLRAKMKADFRQFTDAKTIALSENKNSPDLTHMRLIKSGDTLPLMCYHIYGDSNYYIEVAKANDLDVFTTLTPGMHIFFPPLKK